MLFNSSVFLLFMAVLLPLYALARGNFAKKCVLLVFSYAFYANWDPRYLLLLLGSTVVDFAAGNFLYALKDPRKRRLWLVVSMAVNLGALGVFKYGRFLLGMVGLSGDWLPEEIPPGISFYTFQTMSYTIDMYRRRGEPSRSLFDFALYVAYFPQLVAGPIVRAEELLPQFRPLPALRAENVALGFQRFALGLFKKLVIADRAAVFVDTVFAAPENHGAVTLWCAAYAFALQIYCDFSAYTDMALGLSRAFGIPLPENFDAPYLARSITEFWRRWHMSLSRWLRDYLYIPLGGNRQSEGRTYANLMLTMLLGGLWHGAAWTYVLWGGFHGLLLAVERRLGVRHGEAAEPRFTAGALLRAILTFHLVCIAWVMFRARSFDGLATYLGRMVTAWGDVAGAGYALRWAGAMLLLVLAQYLIRRYRWRETIWERLPALVQGAALAALLVASALFYVDEVAFIYFQF